jgi:hypothetical protein
MEERENQDFNSYLDFVYDIFEVYYSLHYECLLTLLLVEHTSALDRAVDGNPLAELPSTGRSNRLGGSNRLGQEERRKT